MATYSMDGTQENCYPNTTILINKLNLRTQDELDFAEKRIVLANQIRIEKEQPFCNVDFEYYKRLHRQLFQTLYDWAGTVRTIDISKKGTAFCRASEIEYLGTMQFQRLSNMNYFKKMNDINLIDELSDFYNNLNMLHPFREGNGRTQRLFLTLLLRNIGYNVDFSRCDRDLLMIATIQAANGDLTMLKNVMKDLLFA